MNGYLRQSTASQARAIGPFLDDTDFKTAETGLTIANTDIKLRANGTTLANKNSGGGTHQVNGVYSVTWDATDTANVGELYGSVVVAGALPIFFTYTVLEEAVYDALFAASAAGFGTAQTGDAFARLGAPAGASVSADVAAVKTETASLQSDTNDIQSRLPAALVSGRIDASVGAMAANVVTAASMAADAGAEIADAVWDEATAGHTTAGSTGKALTDAGAAGTPPTAAAIADAVWDEATAGHVTAGSTGKSLIDTKSDLTTIVSSIDSTGAADLDAIKAKTDLLTLGAIADAVHDEAVDGATTFRQSTRLANSANGGKVAGAAGTTVTVRDLADTKDRLTVTTDADGNRSAVVRDLT